jgi:hypothetical protein
MDGDIQALTKNGVLIWMPAHQSLAGVGQRRLSSGKRLTIVDWRANRLVDALAKAYARDMAAPDSYYAVLASARAAVTHSAALLGLVTHAANHHREEVVRDDGSSAFVIVRDASDARSDSTHRKRCAHLVPVVDRCRDWAGRTDVLAKAATSSVATAAAPAPGGGVQCTTWHAMPQPTHHSSASRALRAHSMRAREEQERLLCSRVAAIAATSDVPTGRATGAARLEALKQRVKGKAACQ